MTESEFHVVFLTRSISFPFGMAATQRVRLLACGLLESGIDVSILCTQVTERPPFIENQDTKGLHDGIHFEYTTGTTIRSNHFLIRRWHEIRGVLAGIRRLIEIKKTNRACCVYYYGNILVNEPGQWMFFAAIYLLKLPLVVDVSEKPWTISSDGIRGKNTLSPLWGAQAAVVISALLYKWAEQEKARLNREIAILELPILVDVREQKLAGSPQHEMPNVLFAGSPVYDQTIQFILDAMKIVWVGYPKCKLVVTGYRPNDPASKKIIKRVQDQNLEPCIELAGYLPRSELLIKYSMADALLIPLFDDIRSKARFPTKIGEYLASGRPIVTNFVGEAARFFVDRESAYMSASGDPTRYAEKIMEALSNREEATRVGLAGRRIAESTFQYSIHSRRLADLVKSVGYETTHPGKKLSKAL